jgi:hypothetical protein
MATELIPADYAHWLEAVKSRIAAARSRAALAVNAELIRLYHGIGRDILERQAHSDWGSKVIPRIAADLKATFPDMKGFSASNVKYMRYFAEHCPDLQFGQQPADQLPWFHIVTLPNASGTPPVPWRRAAARPARAAGGKSAEHRGNRGGIGW